MQANVDQSRLILVKYFLILVEHSHDVTQLLAINAWYCQVCNGIIKLATISIVIQNQLLSIGLQYMLNCHVQQVLCFHLQIHKCTYCITEGMQKFPNTITFFSNHSNFLNF